MVFGNIIPRSHVETQFIVMLHNVVITTNGQYCPYTLQDYCSYFMLLQ